MLNILRILVLDMMLTLTVWLMMVKQVLRGTTTKTMMTTFTPVLDTILKTFCTKNSSKAKVFALKKVNYYFSLLHLTFWLCSTYVHHWKNIEIICSNTARNFELVSEPSNYLNFNQARAGFVLTLCSLLISLNFFNILYQTWHSWKSWKDSNRYQVDCSTWPNQMIVSWCKLLKKLQWRVSNHN